MCLFEKSKERTTFHVGCFCFLNWEGFPIRPRLLKETNIPASARRGYFPIYYCYLFSFYILLGYLQYDCSQLRTQMATLRLAFYIKKQQGLFHIFVRKNRCEYKKKWRDWRLLIRLSETKKFGSVRKNKELLLLNICLWCLNFWTVSIE